jgi:hypothetical protein
MMTKRAVLVAIVLICLWPASVARAQGMPSPKPARTVPALVDLTRGVSFEVAPHTGMMGSSGLFGLKLAMIYGTLTLEMAGEQVIGKTANLFPISLNLVLNLATRGRLIPYGAVGAGLWLTVPTTALGAETVSTLGINFGGGARYFFTRAFGVRLEAKQYITTVRSERELQEELLFFQEVCLGVTVLFQ